MERRKPAAIDRATALRYMGAAGWTPDTATAALLDKAEEQVLAAAAPRAVYRRLPRTALPLEDCGTDLTRHLLGCGEVLLLAATLGSEIDKHWLPYCWSKSVMSWKVSCAPLCRRRAFS